jgi:DNA helicase II / ATP-dependent DNA helicase PcrA
MPELNDAQRAAVLHGKGPLLVFAGAGSGKTRVITYRIARLLAEDGVPPYRILAVTFTNKAAGEMRDRLEKLAGSLVSDLWVGTFHSISSRMLRRYASEVGLSPRFSIYDDSDQKALINRVIKNAGFDERDYTPKLCMSRIHAKKREGIGPEAIVPSPEFDKTLLEVYVGYERALRAADAVDFDDLILLMVRLLEMRPSPGSLTGHAGEELRRKFDYVLVDEFQDTNAIQYSWVRGFAERTQNLCVVGDDDQSIYAWRGADIRNIRNFAHDFPGAEVIKLEQNYRSTSTIVRAAQKVIEVARDRSEKVLWTEAKAGDKIVLSSLRDEREEAHLVARTLKERIQKGVSPSELAVFYRVNAQSRVIEEALRQNNLPYQIVGGMRFFERAEVKNLLSYLRFLDNPKSDADLVRIFNLPARGLGNKTLDRLLVIATARGISVYEAIEQSLGDGEVGGASRKKLEAFHVMMQELRQAASELHPSELAVKALEKSGYQSALRTENTAEADARLENLAELVGSIKEYEVEVLTQGREPALAEYLERVALVSDADTMEEGASVLLMTVHTAKGLEFDTVLLTGMEEGSFPYRGLESESNAELEEERRLAYVAITRARQRLYISHVACRTIFGKTNYLEPSRFLEQLPEELLERRGLPAWATRVHSAAARARQTEFADPTPEDEWDQRSPDPSPDPGTVPARPAKNPFGARAPFVRASQSPFSAKRSSGAPAASPSPRRAAADSTGERVVDYSAFDDVSSSAPAHADPLRAAPLRAALSYAAGSRPDPARATRARAPSGMPSKNAANKPASGSSGGLPRGTHVFHRRFGSGVVEESEGPDKVVARFKGFGQKKVLLEYLTLKE